MIYRALSRLLGIANGAVLHKTTSKLHCETRCANVLIVEYINFHIFILWFYAHHENYFTAKISRPKVLPMVTTYSHQVPYSSQCHFVLLH